MGASETRRGPNYVVHIRRNAFNDPGLPPFWELTVEDSQHSYRILVGVPADELDVVVQNLPRPSAQRNGVDFIRGVMEVFLPDDIRRLTGETMLTHNMYNVKSAPPGSLYRKGQRYNDADLTRQITYTDADIAENDRRKDALLRRLEAESAEARSPSLRF
ncbi:hypothetical protein ACFFNA_11115 [Mesorhizobium kowhaii]